MEEIFDKIHDNKGAPVSSGVDPNAATMAANEADQAAKKRSAEGGGNSGFNDVVPVPNLASFSVYWDVAEKKYKVFEPRVVGPGGNEITVTPADPGNGIYCCDVRRTSSGSYAAAIKLLAQVERDEETVAVVRLFQISDDRVVQYHAGVINVSDMSITGEEGETEGSQADPVSGNILMSGMRGSGLSVFSFVRNKTENRVGIDLSGRHDSDAFGIHSVTDSEGTEKAKIFSTADVELPKGGGGGGSKEVNAVTGFELSCEDGKLVIKWKTRKIKNVDADDEVTGSPETLLELEEVDAVESVDYDTSDHKLTQTKRTIYVPGKETSPQNPEEVFQATPHSAE